MHKGQNNLQMNKVRNKKNMIRYYHNLLINTCISTIPKKYTRSLKGVFEFA